MQRRGVSHKCLSFAAEVSIAVDRASIDRSSICCVEGFPCLIRPILKLLEVIEYLARKYGVSKSDLLDREADDLVVRIALGETQVVGETKKALDNAGLNVSAMEEFAAGRAGGMKRSNHVLLVKNLPYGSSEAELAKMFGKFGSLDKIIFPPTRTLALVVFLEPAEARAAFKGLAYRRYKDVPLYLEWPPENILSQNSSDNNSKSSLVVGEQEAKRALLEQHVEGVSDVEGLHLNAFLLVLVDLLYAQFLRSLSFP